MNCIKKSDQRKQHLECNQNYSNLIQGLNIVFYGQKYNYQIIDN